MSIYQDEVIIQRLKEELVGKPIPPGNYYNEWYIRVVNEDGNLASHIDPALGAQENRVNVTVMRGAITQIDWLG